MICGQLTMSHQYLESFTQKSCQLMESSKYPCTCVKLATPPTQKFSKIVCFICAGLCRKNFSLCRYGFSLIKDYFKKLHAGYPCLLLYLPCSWLLIVIVITVCVITICVIQSALWRLIQSPQMFSNNIYNNLICFPSQLFKDDIMYLLTMDKLWKKRKAPTPLDWQQLENSGKVEPVSLNVRSAN